MTQTNYSDATVFALDQFSVYSKTTPMMLLDLRCEYDLPRYIDLKEPENTAFNEQNFAWFQMPHDFTVPSS